MEKLLIAINFSFGHNAFKKSSAVEASESVYMWERVKTNVWNLFKPVQHIDAFWHLKTVCYEEKLLIVINLLNKWTFYLSLPIIRQFCSRRLLKCIGKSTENPFIWKNNNWIEMKTWWQKEKLLVLNNFFFCCHVFKMLSAAVASESVYMRERDNYTNTYFP